MVKNVLHFVSPYMLIESNKLLKERSEDIKMDFLYILDEHYNNYDFLYLENLNFDYVSAQVILFTDKQDWLMVFQVVGVEQEGPQTDVYYYSSKKEVGFGIVTLDTIQLQNWSYDGLPKESLYKGEVIILGQLYKYHFNREQYSRFNMDVNSEAAYTTHVLRVIKEVLKPSFFITPEELLATCNVGENWQHFYSTNAWQHTEVEDVPPSENIFFHSLHAALVHENPNLIQVGTVNTNWHNWTEYDFDQQKSWELSMEEEK